MCYTHSTKLNNSLFSFRFAMACTVCRSGGERIWGCWPYHLLHLFAAVCLHIQERSEKMTHDNPTGNWIGQHMRLPRKHGEKSQPSEDILACRATTSTNALTLELISRSGLGIQLFPLRLTRTSPALQALDCLVAKKERGIKKKKSACRIT